MSANKATVVYLNPRWYSPVTIKTRVEADDNVLYSKHSDVIVPEVKVAVVGFLQALKKRLFKM